MKKPQIPGRSGRPCRCVVFCLLVSAFTVWSFQHIGFPAEAADATGSSDLQQGEEEGYENLTTRSQKLELLPAKDEIRVPRSPEFESTEDACEGRRMYIHPLPPEFNEAILALCDAYESWTSFCDHAKNGGFGPRTHRRSRSWYRTDAFMLELIFHNRAKRYDCLTESSTEADVFFLPYYAGLDALRYLYGDEIERGAEHGARLVQWLRGNASEAWQRRGGTDHFVVMGRPAWDFSRPLGRADGWGTSILEAPAMFNVTSLVLESRAFPWQDQAVPYPTAFHPASAASLSRWIARVKRSRRSFLFAFAGGGGTGTGPNIRHSIREECPAPDTVAPADTPVRCLFISCDGERCDHDPGYLMRAMMKADFCLQPPGDTPTRRSTFDGIVAGCIPVFFEPQGAYTQYTWHLPREPREYSVLIPKDEVVFGHARIGDILGNISRAEVAQMRELVIGLIPRVVYRKPDAPGGAEFKDAFDVALEGVLRRVKSLQAGPAEQEYGSKSVFL
uniref:TSA: Wollemia nobilis Ref_Wollemi_Transcript_25498_1888 transcribed RNA sequence n=1 Tax=Wollemia nobilis TaxID=56998 RepID=A0A0C9S4A7_9CONI